MKPNCIIAARAGSKRIKNKNILKLFGQHMIGYSIKMAIKSKIFNNVFVSTESKKIKKISEKYGAKVPFLRPKKLSDDNVGLHEVLIDFIKRNELYDQKFLIFIYATAILVEKKMILNAIRKFKKTQSDYLIAIQEYKHNPLRSLEINKNSLKFSKISHSNKNTNSLKKFYHDSGSFFIFKPKSLIESPKKLPFKTTFYLHKKFEVCDIDDKEDLKLAKILLKYKQNVQK